MQRRIRCRECRARLDADQYGAFLAADWIEIAHVCRIPIREPLQQVQEMRKDARDRRIGESLG
jgi:hypothetical protein